MPPLSQPLSGLPVLFKKKIKATNKRTKDKAGNSHINDRQRIKQRSTCGMLEDLSAGVVGFLPSSECAHTNFEYPVVRGCYFFPKSLMILYVSSEHTDPISTTTEDVVRLLLLLSPTPSFVDWGCTCTRGWMSLSIRPIPSSARNLPMVVSLEWSGLAERPSSARSKLDAVVFLGSLRAKGKRRR